MIKLLVVDDNKFLRFAITKLFKQYPNYQVYEAGDGESAIELAKDIQPDCISIDYEMPGLNGIETCRRLRELPQFASTLLVLVTGSDLPDTMAQAKESSIDHVVFKRNPDDLRIITDYIDARFKSAS